MEDFSNPGTPETGGEGDSFFSFWNTGETDPATPTEGGESPTPEVSQGEYVPRSEFDAISNQLRAEAQWKKDLANFIAGNNQQETGLTDADIHQMFLDKPLDFTHQITNQAVQQAVATVSQQFEANQVINEYKQKYPNLVPFEEEIGLYVNKVQQIAQSQNRQLGMRETLDQAINLFTQKFGPVLGQAATGDVKNLAMKLDVGRPMTSQSNQKPNISQMSDEEFRAYDAQIRARFNQ